MRPSLLLLVFVGGGIGSVCRYAMASALQFPVEFVEYDVAEQW